MNGVWAWNLVYIRISFYSGHLFCCKASFQYDKIQLGIQVGRTSHLKSNFLSIKIPETNNCIVEMEPESNDWMRTTTSNGHRCIKLEYLWKPFKKMSKNTDCSPVLKTLQMSTEIFLAPINTLYVRSRGPFVNKDNLTLQKNAVCGSNNYYYYLITIYSTHNYIVQWDIRLQVTGAVNCLGGFIHGDRATTCIIINLSVVVAAYLFSDYEHVLWLFV